MDNTVKLLVDKSKKGHTEAFEQLVKMYQNKVYALCYQLTNSQSDAQDLAQEAFVKAYRSLSGFRNEADFGTWIHRITVNLWINTKRRRRPELSLDATITTDNGEVSFDVPSDDESPEDIIERKEFSSLVQRTMNGLSEEHRTVLILREMHGYNYDEIAQIMNCSLGTVKSRINRARQNLKKMILKEAWARDIQLPGKKKH
ncbi:sigma-70 family RNA polymerase sigma factor [Desulfallas thermosapovorans]|uniref:RNA polymerase sigma factor n=1 Tax=Desulfallas thermosapovorans DSM 6562 TaxID=1121431 RepID=A0A5S4ZUJ3_9FIRM|nr:sigma-70 family RNA polymerase sigma factor [Desulfallas thermosapovorans]TYO96578.1 RNA polymerase RpoE-like sigma-24 subunit [Desulfallas thermosapovorans DSM 6562]